MLPEVEVKDFRKGAQVYSCSSLDGAWNSTFKIETLLIYIQ